jgi:hypothetical protein
MPYFSGLRLKFPTQHSREFSSHSREFKSRCRELSDEIREILSAIGLLSYCRW